MGTQTDSGECVSFTVEGACLDKDGRLVQEVLVQRGGRMVR